MRVILYEDNTAIRDSLSILLDGMPGIELIGAFPNPVNWDRQLQDAQPDVIMMDIEMPGLDGIRATQAIHAKYPLINIVMLTVFEEEDKIFRALCAGAVGYILKNSTPTRLIEAVQDAHAGGAPLSPSIARKAVQVFQQLPTPASSAPHYALTTREQETLKYLVEGLSYKMIADRMNISYETVRTYMKHIYEKLHVVSMTEAVAKALREGLV
ncbi:response regulator transcription factor [Spirosoma taeanense]|uniref:Response regulator transcription factor n=1 Tax=Spirosoma taeanense TaxID=2735870 RepID=A0A6M5YA64_9BACT|nr:response regulator transcription factor [Spirosoma taeanense]QJW90180.1 response regulator transcription factor [Spirosoma taeanense]